MQRTWKLGDRLSGTVTSFDRSKGWGFIRPEGVLGRDVFVHWRDCPADKGGWRSLAVGQRVQFMVGEGKRGFAATEIVVLEGAHAPV